MAGFRSCKKKVVILGGGVAGMTAAHELIERGFDVEVYERNTIPGGKARSLNVYNAKPPPWAPTREVNHVKEGNRPLPGEHGFRFFPGFYRHITDTMRRIPYCRHGSGIFRRSVKDNLVMAEEFCFCFNDQAPLRMTIDAPLLRLGRLKIPFRRFQGRNTFMGMAPEEVKYLAQRMWQLLTTCPERSLSEYEQLDWHSFHDYDNRSTMYRKLFIGGMTRSLVAAKPSKASTFTAGKILIQLMFDSLDPRSHADRVLNGPTNDVWLFPWREHLEYKGVQYLENITVLGIQYDKASNRITGAEVEEKGQRRIVTGDYYVLAIPLEKVVDLIPEALQQQDQTIKAFVNISDHVEWMNGVMIYLKKDVRLSSGHINYVDSPWAITALSQSQFWAPEFNLTRFGDGQVKGVLSAIISDWETPGFNGKRALDCTPDEIFLEIWETIKRGHSYDGEDTLVDDDVYCYFIDPAVRFKRNENGDLRPVESRERLLVNHVNSWSARPESYTRMPNLFLAADYVRTYTDLATMEAANESGRRAANGILSDSRSAHSYCRIWDLRRPSILWFARYRDSRRFHCGLPWKIKIIDWYLLNPLFLATVLINVLVMFLVLIPIALVRRTIQRLRRRYVHVHDRVNRAEFRISRKLGRHLPRNYRFNTEEQIMEQ